MRTAGQYYVRKGKDWFVGRYEPKSSDYPWTLSHDPDYFATSYFDEIGEPIPTRDELRELREKAELWDRLGEEFMHLQLIEGKPHLPPRKATP